MAAFGQAISQQPTTQEFENIFASIQALITTLQTDVHDLRNVVQEHHQAITQIKDDARNNASSTDRHRRSSRRNQPRQTGLEPVTCGLEDSIWNYA